MELLLAFITYWVLCGGGMWIFSDAVYSITLYLSAPSYEGSKKQTWGRDHWVRVVRGIMGGIMMVSGWYLFKGMV